MDSLLAWLEGSPLGHAMRNSGVWTYGLVNLTHILGIASLFGAILVLDLRLVGLWRNIPLALLSRPTIAIATTGFVVAVISGVCLISTNGSEYIGNPFLLIKFPAIAVAVINAALVRRLSGWKALAARDATPAELRQLSVAGAVSLVSWFTAVAAGRMIGYW